MSIRLLDVAAPYQALRAATDAAVSRVLASGSYVAGAEGAAFEQELAAYLEVREVVGVNSGTDALVLALKALGIGPGDDVVVPTYTYFASAEAVCLAGARPRFADCSADSFNSSVDDIERACTPNTKAVISVHLFGEPADCPAIAQFCKARHLHLIEDAAQALGASLAGTKVGAWGTAAAFSFYPTKNLSACGDGGAISCNDVELAQRVRLLRNHTRRGDEHLGIGHNSRLDEIQAAILRVRLPHLETWNARRRALARRYRDGLSGTRCTLPHRDDPARVSVFHQFVITHPQRDPLRAFLATHEVETAIYYPTPCHDQVPFRAAPDHPTLPVAERHAREALALPIHPQLTDAAVDCVIDLLRRFEQTA